MKNSIKLISLLMLTVPLCASSSLTPSSQNKSMWQSVIATFNSLKNYFSSLAYADKDIQATQFLTYERIEEAGALHKITEKQLSEHIKNKTTNNLKDVYLELDNGMLLAVKPGLPKGEQRPINISPTPLIGCYDKHTFDRGAINSIKALRDNAVAENSVSISYELPVLDNRAFDFGGPNSQRLLTHVLDQINKNNPQAPIAILSTCAGTTGILNVLANPDAALRAKEQIKAVNLESAALSSSDVWENMDKKQLSWPLRGIISKGAPYYFPSCNVAPKSTAQIVETYKNVPRHIAFIFAEVKNDPVTPTESTDLIANTLKNQGNPVEEVFVSTDPKISHGKIISRSKEYHKKSREFFDKYLKKTE